MFPGREGDADRDDRHDLALCDAPGCGQLFFQRRTNQAWCGPGCGNRARVARHHQGHS
ncbi:CGNR zinc finger domain-containing protein [Kribbella sp. NPDC051587]|uniref:CGNR zinc finger domain-containing protein n=1 Tax=Kribbella sp. NPDC051587 TaxID=3364119 RepID=UPI0037B0421F